MARILKPGVKPEDRLFRGECRRCGCVAEWAAGEVVSEHHPNEPYGAMTAECPHCKGRVWVQETKQKPPIDPWERREQDRIFASGKLTMTNIAPDPRHSPMRPFPYGPGMDAARKGKSQ